MATAHPQRRPDAEARMQGAKGPEAQLTWKPACCCISRSAGATHCCAGVLAALLATGLAAACEQTATFQRVDEAVTFCCRGCRHEGGMRSRLAMMKPRALHMEVPLMPAVAAQLHGGNCGSQPTCWLMPCCRRCCCCGGGERLQGGRSAGRSWQPGPLLAGKVASCCAYSTPSVHQAYRLKELAILHLLHSIKHCVILAAPQPRSACELVHTFSIAGCPAAASHVMADMSAAAEGVCDPCQHARASRP